MINDYGVRENANDGGDRRKAWAGDSGTSVDRRRFLQATGVGVAGTTLGYLGSGLASAQQGSLKIGVLAPEPANNPIGASMANAAKLAASQVNDEGGAGGRQLEVVVKDTKEDPSTGRRAYQELTVGENVDVTTGVFTSEVLMNILNDIAQQQTLHLTTGAATPQASLRVNQQYDRYKYHFRPGPLNAHDLGVNLVDFAKAKFGDFGWESVAVLVEDFQWTVPVSAVLNEQLSGIGTEITMNRRYAAGTENFTPIYDQVQNGGADAAFVAMAHTGTAALVQWAKQQRPFEFGGIHVPMQLPSYYDAVDGAARFGITQNSATPTSEITDQTVPFANAYQKRFDSLPVYTGYITFDAVKQYATAVEEAGSANADDLIPVLEGISYTGTVGTIEYYPKDNEFAHDVVYDPDKVFPVFQQWQERNGEGVQEVIFPDDLATAEHRAPPWI